MNHKRALSQTFLAVSLAAVPMSVGTMGCAGDDIPSVAAAPTSVLPQPASQAVPKEATETATPDGGIAPSVPIAPEPIAVTTLAPPQADQGGTEAEPQVVQSGFLIDPEKSLLIRSPSVVDGSRTSDPCDLRRRGIAPGPSALTWTFGYLMTQMANGRSTALFAHNWLANWSISNRVNGHELIALRARDQGTTLPGRIYDAWQRNSNGTPGGTVSLAMNRAPFRLLAIVNRFDLRKNRRDGEGNSGELRFVFSVLDLDRTESNAQQTCLQASSIDAPGTSTPGDQLLILEYAVNHLSDTARRDWIQRWTALTDLDITQAPFANALEQLTQTVVAAGAGGGSRPNGSALIRLRTNESTDGVHWDLREFRISATTGYLEVDTVKQTPKASFTPVDAETGLINWVANPVNRTPILTDTHTVPAQYLGAHSINTSSITTWTGPFLNAGVDPLVAYEFSRRTCVGCHSADTGSSFFHVRGRPYQQTAEISHFLDGQYPGAPDGCPQDPNGDRHCFGELQARTNDIFSYLSGGG